MELAKHLINPAQQQMLLRQLDVIKPNAREGIREYANRYEKLFQETEAPDGPAAVEKFLFTLPIMMQRNMQRYRVSRSTDGITPYAFFNLAEVMRAVISLEGWDNATIMGPPKDTKTPKKECALHGQCGHSSANCCILKRTGGVGIPTKANNNATSANNNTK